MRKKNAASFMLTAFLNIKPGLVLLSHTAAHAVPSALKGLTSVFGMGTGVALSLSRPETLKSQIDLTIEVV